MFYLDFLQKVHEVAAPSSYLEIGVRHGDSLALSTSTAVGIDPEYDIRVELPPTATLYRGLSDDYFASGAIAGHLPGGRIELAFIDGMHLFEYALSDFVHVEAHSTSRTVVVMDDVLPRSSAEAQRERVTADWTGDVWKLLPILARHRPDLTVIRIATEPTGLLMILGLDAESTVLSAGYDDIAAEFLDVAEVPRDIVDRDGAVAPEDLLAAPFWAELRAGNIEPARAWTGRPLDAEEIETSKQSPWRDQPWAPAAPAGRMVAARRRIRARLGTLARM